MSTALPHGFCELVCDAEKGMVVTPEWVKRAMDLAGGPMTVRVKLAADPFDQMPTGLYARGLNVWKDLGNRVRLQLPHEFSQPWLRKTSPLMVYPNDPLGYKHDPTLNQYIDIFSLRACGVLPRLVGLFDELLIGNEENENAKLPLGHNVPPGTGGAKVTSMSTANAAALYISTAARVRSPHYNVQVPILIGSLSCLGRPFFTDPHGDWVGGYVDEVLSFVDAHGKRHMRATDRPYPFDGIVLNMEGYYDAAHAFKVRDAVKAVMAKHGWVGPIVVGESGIEGNPPAGQTLDSMRSLLAAFPDGVEYFQGPFYVPGDPTQWGLQDWTVANAGYYPRGSAKPIAAEVFQAFQEVRV